MKLVIVGGGGIRTPMLVDLIMQREMLRIGQKLIDRVTLMDVQPERLAVVLALANYLRDVNGSELAFEATTDLNAALEDADFIVTTIRPGFEQGRIYDEKVAIENGCIGQETTGPGGFAMAMRSIPEVLKVAEIAAKQAPKSWLLNFTNPSGIVTQALYDAGYTRVVGICDSADSLHGRVASTIEEPHSELKSQVFGLNHCSATLKMTLRGEDVTSRLMSDDRILSRHLAIFDHKDILGLGGLPNEYLYYYLYPKKALAQLQGKKSMRAEKIKVLNDKFFARAVKPEFRKDPGALLAFHQRTILARHSSYMDYAWKDTDHKSRPIQDEELGGEGYAGVALDFMEAVNETKPVELAMNVPAGRPIAGLAAREVVETTCKINRKKIEPILPEQVPERLADLIRQMKTFENLTCMAARQKSRRLALWALEANPLVRFRSKAEKLLAGYTKAHGGVFEELR
jgi:alpha-galactosidase/6-phospho-beta-glucosidase family protein